MRLTIKQKNVKVLSQNLQKLQNAYIAMNVGFKMMSQDSSTDTNFSQFAVLALCSHTIINNLQKIPQNFDLKSKYPDFFNFIFTENGLFGREDRIVFAHNQNFMEIYQNNHSHMKLSFHNQWYSAFTQLQNMLERENIFPTVNCNGTINNLISFEDFTTTKQMLQQTQHPLVQNLLMQNCIAQIMLCQKVSSSDILETLEGSAIFSLLQQSIHESIVTYYRYTSESDVIRIFLNTNLESLRFQPWARNQFAHSHSILENHVKTMRDLMKYQIDDRNVREVLKLINQNRAPYSREKLEITNNDQAYEDKQELVVAASTSKPKKNQKVNKKKKEQQDGKLLAQCIAENKELEENRFFSPEEMKNISEIFLELALRCQVGILHCDYKQFKVRNPTGNERQIKTLLEELNKFGIKFKINLKSSSKNWQNLMDEILSHNTFDPNATCEILEKLSSTKSGLAFIYQVKPMITAENEYEYGYNIVTKSGFDVLNFCTPQKSFEMFKKFFAQGMDIKSVLGVIVSFTLKNAHPALIISIIEYMYNQDLESINSLSREISKAITKEASSYLLDILAHIQSCITAIKTFESPETPEHTKEHIENVANDIVAPLSEVSEHELLGDN